MLDSIASKFKAAFSCYSSDLCRDLRPSNDHRDIGNVHYVEDFLNRWTQIEGFKNNLLSFTDLQKFLLLLYAIDTFPREAVLIKVYTPQFFNDGIIIKKDGYFGLESQRALTAVAHLKSN
jgi:hypothetical protein